MKTMQGVVQKVGANKGGYGYFTLKGVDGFFGASVKDTFDLTAGDSVEFAYTESEYNGKTTYKVNPGAVKVGAAPAVAPSAPAVRGASTDRQRSIVLQSSGKLALDIVIQARVHGIDPDILAYEVAAMAEKLEPFFSDSAKLASLKPASMVDVAEVVNDEGEPF